MCDSCLQSNCWCRQLHCYWDLNTYAAVLWSSDWFFIMGNKWGLWVRRVLWGMLLRGWRCSFPSPDYADMKLRLSFTQHFVVFFFYRHLLALWAITLLPCAPASGATERSPRFSPLQTSQMSCLEVWGRKRSWECAKRCKCDLPHDAQAWLNQ